MSLPVTLPVRENLPLRQRASALLAVGLARLLVLLRPARQLKLLRFARRRAMPASATQALAARRDVLAVSPRSADCPLRRSIATALLCRARGVWPTWCTGVRTAPFAAHAWIEVDGHPVGEPHAPAHYRRLQSIPPR